jgi:hypothetical protein|tara:strand:+ start:441 stop:683 length:243 start_codon:yes stop_codon:yes gene_type:complete
MSHDSILKTKAVKACSELIELLDVKKNDGWMFVQEENQGGWAVIAARSPKELLSMTYELLSLVCETPEDNDEEYKFEECE